MKTLYQKLNTVYANMKLQSKLMVSYLVLISIPMVALAFFFYGKVYSMIVSDTILSQQEESSKAAPAIEAILDQILGDVKEIRSLSFYEDFFQLNSKEDLESFASDPAAASFSAEAEAILADSFINDLHIYVDLPSSQLEDLSTLSNGFFDPMSKVRSTYWKGIFSGTGVSALYCPSFYLSSYEVQNYGDTAYITRHSLILDGTSYTVYTAAYFSSSLFMDALNSVLPSQGSVAYIINDRNSIIASTDLALSGTYALSYETIEESFMSSNNFLKKTVLDEEIYAGIYSITHPRWYMVVVIPSKPLLQKSDLVMIQYIGLFLGCILAALFIAVSLSRSIAKRLSVVTAQMEQVKKGPPVPLKPPLIHDEIGDLIDTFNYMSAEMTKLLEERALAAEELRIAEFNSLQAQINPHFLYNTMDMINWMASQGQTKEIASIVRDLSRFYKLTLSKKETITTIEQEIEHVSIYLRLQNIRFHNNIGFVVDIPDDLMEHPIPKLTLQPVVENAILHGIMEKEDKKGNIVITGWLEQDMAVLLISDDGVGILPEKLDHILSGEGQSQKGSNIAIYNTHHRLQILYGEEYGLSYQSVYGKGTDVFIRLPIQQEFRLFHENSMVQINSEKNETANTTMVQPDVLLSYSQKNGDDTYVLQNLHQISDKLPDKEPLYILTHHIAEDFPPHTHNYFEMSFVCRGQIVNCIDGQELIQSLGDVFILNQKAVQAQRKLDSENLLVNFCLGPELFQSCLSDFYTDDNPLAEFFRGESREASNFIFLPLGHNRALQNLLDTIMQEYAKADFYYTEKIGSLLEELFFSFLKSGEYSFEGMDRQAYDIYQYIKEHCILKSLEEIASEVYETPQSLARYIKRRCGRELEDIIDETRVSLGRSLLEEPHKNIYEIAQACGYEDLDRFCEKFYKVYKIMPEEYRKQFL